MTSPYRFTARNLVHIFALSAFAFAQPLFDLLGASPQYFSARHSQAIDILVFTGVLIFGIPAIISAAIMLAGLMGRRVQSLFHLLCVGLLLALIVTPVFTKLAQIGDITVFAVAAVVTVTGALLYAKWSVFRGFATMLSLALVVFPLQFLLGTDVKNILEIGGGTTEAASGVAASTKGKPVNSVVVVVLDELPLTSLMDSANQIDRERFPNFARLADRSTWYRNATSVAAGTLRALPAIMTGKLPTRDNRLATAQAYPENIFTFMGATHRINNFESITSLCPAAMCDSDVPETGARLRSLALDTSIVYLHLVAPPGAAKKLPDVSQNWGNFLSPDEPAGEQQDGQVHWLKDIVRAWQKKTNRPQRFLSFARSIPTDGTPTFSFLHVLLPHVPFHYLPSGKKYHASLWPESVYQGRDRDVWVDDWAAARMYQQSLLQLVYLDSLLGQFIDILEESSVFDESLIVFVSDHGASYQPGGNRRLLTRENYMDLLPVLMLIKEPGQRRGYVSDRNVETTDIIPTLADMLGRETPFTTAGQSILDSERPEREHKLAYSKLAQGLIEFEPQIDRKYQAVIRKNELLGEGEAPIAVYGMGLPGHLIGKSVEEAGYDGEHDPAFDIRNRGLYDNLDLNGSFSPARIVGVVNQAADDIRQRVIAVAVNGSIQAVSRLHPDGERLRFSVIVPEEAFRQGSNDLAVFFLDDEEA